MSNPDQLHGTIAKGPLHAIHASPAVRDALLDYHERPADDEAAAVVAAISAAISPAEHARLLAEQVLSIDMVTERGLKAKELARAVLGEAQESPAELALRSLASWLGVGGYNASAIDAKTMERRIRDGVAQLMTIAGPEISEAAAMAATVPASPHRPSPEWYAAMIQSTVDDDFQIGPAFVAAPRDHEIAALVNRVRDVAIEFHGAQQLRVRIAEIIVPALKGMQAPVAGQPAEPSPALSADEIEQLEKAVDDFIECGETDVPDSLLQRFASLGLLECSHYKVMPSAHDIIDAYRAAPKGDSNG